MEANHTTELLAALTRARHYANAEKMDMLCKAGGYSEAAFRAAEQSAHWRRVMADCELIDSVIAKATGAFSA